MVQRVCICGCGRAFDVEPGRRGRPRVHYEDSCRKRAERQRAQAGQWIPAVDVASLQVAIDPADRQIEQAVAEAAAIAAAFRSLAVDGSLPPKLAAGCELMAIDLIALLDRRFPGWST